MNNIMDVTLDILEDAFMDILKKRKSKRYKAVLSLFTVFNKITEDVVADPPVVLKCKVFTVFESTDIVES